MPSLKFRKYPLSHRVISYLRDKDIRGVRKLSVVLPKILLPNPQFVGEHILQTLHGLKLKINPSVDSGVELSVFETGTYEKGILTFLKRNLNSGDCFVDVGANIGLMTLVASQCVGNSGKVISYEAHPETVKILEFNLNLNSISNVEVCNYALGSTNCSSIIYDNWHINRGGASLIVKTENSAAYSVEIRRLDDSRDSTIHPKIIKIDVEGFELEVLKGAEETIKKFKPILIIELSSKRDNSYSINELMDFIESFNCYKIFKLKGTKERVSPLIQINSREELPDHDNIICIVE